MLTTQARRIGESLVERHVLSRDALEAALLEAEETGQPLPAVLLRSGLVGSKDLTAALAESLGMRFVDLLDAPLHQTAASTVPAEVARRHSAIGIDFEDHKLVVAFAEPSDDEAVAAVGAATGYEIVPAVADRAELHRAVDAVYGAVGGAPPGEPAGRMSVGAPGEANIDDLGVNDLLDRVLQARGSDLHLAAGQHPTIRIHGELVPLTDLPVLNGSDVRQMVYSLITQKQREKFENDLELDTSYSLPGKSRFRVNVFLQRDAVGAVMRVIPYEIVDFDGLGIPESVKWFAGLARGLVLVTGPTGSGQVDDPGVAHRHRQPREAPPHHDGRGPDRVPPQSQAVAREPA